MSYEWKCSVLTSVSVHAICVAIFLYSSVAIILLVAYLAIVTCLDNSFLVRFLSDTHNQNACMNCSNFCQNYSLLAFISDNENYAMLLIRSNPDRQTKF